MACMGVVNKKTPSVPRRKNFSRSEKASVELHEGATCVQFTRQSLKNEKIQVFPSASIRHVRPKFGSNIRRTLTLQFTTQQAPMKLKLAEGAYNRIRWAMGQLFAPRAFGSKKYALSLRARAGPLRNFRALLYYCNPELRVLSSA